MAVRNSNPGVAAAAVGLLLLIEILIVRVGFGADSDHVYLAGNEIVGVCSFKQGFGVPCPTCGMTRSIVLSAHGRFYEAFVVNPAGVLAVGGLLAFSSMMFVLAWKQRSKTGDTTSLRRRIKNWTLIYSALTVLTLIGHWLRGIQSS